CVRKGMDLVIFGANGPTGLELCRQAHAAGHRVTAAVRRPEAFPLQNDALMVVQANVMDGSSLTPVVGDADAVLSSLATGYGWHEMQVYSVGTKAIVDAMRASDHHRRLVVVSAGLVVPGHRHRRCAASSRTASCCRSSETSSAGRCTRIWRGWRISSPSVTISRGRSCDQAV